MRVEDPARTDGTANTEPETIANTAAKAEVAEDVHVALKDPKKGGDNVVVDNASKADEWLLFWESLCYKIQG